MKFTKQEKKTLNAALKNQKHRLKIVGFNNFGDDFELKGFGFLHKLSNEQDCLIFSDKTQTVFDANDKNSVLLVTGCEKSFGDFLKPSLIIEKITQNNQTIYANADARALKAVAQSVQSFYLCQMQNSNISFSDNALESNAMTFLKANIGKVLKFSIQSPNGTISEEGICYGPDYRFCHTSQSVAFTLKDKRFVTCIDFFKNKQRIQIENENGEILFWSNHHAENS